MQDDDQMKHGRKRGKWASWLLGAALFLLVMAFFGEETPAPSGVRLQTAVPTATPSPTPTLKLVSIKATTTPVVTTTAEVATTAVATTPATATPSPTVAPTSTATEAPSPAPTTPVAVTSLSAEPSVQRQVARSDAEITLVVTFNAVCVENQHVGKNWTQEYFLFAESVPEQVAVRLRVGDELCLRAVIAENDKRPDIGADETYLTITKDVLTSPLVVEKTVLVTENAGRYAGYSAEWTVTYTITVLTEDGATGGEQQ